MDTLNVAQPRVVSLQVHSGPLNLRLTGSTPGTDCAHNNKLKFH